MNKYDLSLVKNYKLHMSESKFHKKIVSLSNKEDELNRYYQEIRLQLTDIQWCIACLCDLRKGISSSEILDEINYLLDISEKRYVDLLEKKQVVIAELENNARQQLRVSQNLESLEAHIEMIER